MKIILITYIYRYDDITENVGIAINKDVALKYTEELKAKFPYVYGDGYGYFDYEEFYLIDEGDVM